MKIESYEVGLNAKSSLTQKLQRSEDATLLTQTKSDLPKEDALSLIDNSSKKVVFNGEQDMPIEDQIKKRLIEQLLGQISGYENTKLYPNDNQKTNIDATNPYNQDKNTNAFAFSYNSTEEYYEKTTLDFSAQAVIQTSKGEFTIDLNLSYSKEFYSRNETSIEAYGTGKNPFNLDFSQTLENIENMKKQFSFEFDNAKSNENSDVPMLEDGVGYIALDKNANGEVDDGGELFGVNTGDGFEELRAYDEDGNNWIDENDSVFQDLRIWEKDENGEPSLVSLADSGIGAIYLSSIAANPSGNEQASIYLKENGEAGVVSNFDMKV